MSPSEADLRAALGRGADDDSDLDVDRIVQQGRLHLARRRVRLLSAAAVTAVVGVGVGAFALRGGDGSTNGASRANPAVATAADGRAALAPSVKNALPAERSAASQAGAGTLTPTSCPSTRPQPLPPGGNGTAGNGRLFPGPVQSVLVCSYGPPGGTGATASSMTLTGGDATALVTSLENASRKNLVAPCPSGSSTRQRVLALIGVRSDGVRLPAVAMILSDPACNVSVTNGRTTRYDWTPDPALVARIFSSPPQPATTTTGRPPRIPTGRPPGGMNGSPLH